MHNMIVMRAVYGCCQPLLESMASLVLLSLHQRTVEPGTPWLQPACNMADGS